MNPYAYAVYLKNMLAQRDRFIGPQQELTQLIAQVSGERPGAVLILGPWGVGKSFLLQLLTDHAGQLFGSGLGFREALGRPFRDNPERLLFVLVAFDRHDEAHQDGERILQHLLARLLAAVAQVETERQFQEVTLAVLQELLREDERAPRLHPDLRQMLLNYEAGLVLQLGRESDVLEGPPRRRMAPAGLDDHALQTQCGELLERLVRRFEGDRSVVPALDSLRVVFLIDDFDQVARYIDRERYDKLRALLESVSMVITSGQPLSRVVTPSRLSSPFFQLLQLNTGRNVFNLFFLTPDHAYKLVKHPPAWAGLDFRFSDSDAEFIIELAGLHHDAIRLICEYLYNYLQRTSLPGPDRLPMEHRPAFRVLLRQPVDALFTRLWRRQLQVRAQQILAQVARDEPLDAMIVDDPDFARLLQSNLIILKEGRFQLFAGLFRDFVLDQSLPDESQGGAFEPQLFARLERDMGLKESQLLRLLWQERGAVVSRERIAEVLYKGDRTQAVESGRLEALVSRVRSKLRGKGYDVQNVRGEGYRIIHLSSGSASL